jgi:regulator of sigma E protease
MVWLPLGGYVKISGMIDESMDKEQMALPPGGISSITLV